MYIMWRDKLIEAKAAKGITTKSISEKTNLSEKTVSRIMKGETMFPALDDVISIASALGLTAHSLFEDTTSVVGGEEMRVLQENYAKATEDLKNLELAFAEMKGEIEKLRIEIYYKNEIIALHNHYQKIINTNKE